MSRVRGVAPVRVRLSDPPAYHAPEGDLQLQCARASLSGTDGIVLKYSSPLARLPWTTRAQQGTLGVIGIRFSHSHFDFHSLRYACDGTRQALPGLQGSPPLDLTIAIAIGAQIDTVYPPIH